MNGYVGDCLVEDGVMKRYIGVGGEVLIPEGVTEIGESAFIHCAAVSAVELPESVRVIRSAAFSWRTGLLQVKLPHSLRVIEEGAFEGCSGLRHVVLPEGLCQVHTAAFYGCQQLETIRIPGSLRQFEDFLEPGCDTAILAPATALGDIPEHYRLQAAHGFACLGAERETVPEEIRREYRDYIGREKERLCKRAMKSWPLLQYLMQQELIEPEPLSRMLAQAMEKKDFELTASLLDYQGRWMSPEKLRQRAQQEEEQLAKELWEF